MAKNNFHSLQLLTRIVEAKKYFTKKEYVDTVELSRELFERGQFDLCEKQLEKLPSSAELLGNLVEKLGPQKGRPKGKSVYKTLKKLQEGRVESSLVAAKGLSSLLTHVFIECEHGNDEYKVLVPNIVENLNEIIFNTLR